MTNIPDTPALRPQIHLQAGRSRRFRAGHPWIFSNEIAMTAEAKALPPGRFGHHRRRRRRTPGRRHLNPHSPIGVRILSRDPDAVIDQAFLTERLRQALALRQQLYGSPYYRLIHAEADGLPGLIVDRYGDIVALQVNTAGMEVLLRTFWRLSMTCCRPSPFC